MSMKSGSNSNSRGDKSSSSSSNSNSTTKEAKQLTAKATLALFFSRCGHRVKNWRWKKRGDETVSPRFVKSTARDEIKGIGSASGECWRDTSINVCVIVSEKGFVVHLTTTMMMIYSWVFTARYTYSYFFFLCCFSFFHLLFLHSFLSVGSTRLLRAHHPSHHLFIHHHQCQRTPSDSALMITIRRKNCWWIRRQRVSVAN